MLVYADTGRARMQAMKYGQAYVWETDHADWLFHNILYQVPHTKHAG